MPNYRSLTVNGFYSDTANTMPASIRFNNPGAINGNAAWVQAFPGFVKTQVIGGGNPIAIMETPEQGVALWWTLMRKYREGGHTTLGQIINRYGGGQDYSAYVAQVEKWSNLSETTEIDLNDNRILLPFAKAMFRYEAGKTSPLSDAQILYGFNLGRTGGKAPDSPAPTQNWLVALLSFLAGLFRRAPATAPSKPLSGTPWVPIIRGDTGLKETRDGAVILSWRAIIAKAFAYMTNYVFQYTSPTGQPWCGFGLAAAFARCGIAPPFGPTDTDRFMWADSWSRNWGQKLTGPIPGCIGVRTRNGGGHVTMVEKVQGKRIWCRGYNQSDSCNVSEYALDDKWTGFYWPPGYPIVSVEPNISNAVKAGKES